VDARSVLGVSRLRPAFLVDVPATEPRESQAGLGAWIMIERPVFTHPFRVDDDDPEDDDDFEDEDDDEAGDDENEEEEDGDEPETWQVRGRGGDSR
jgi:hypothetical protein